MAASSVTGRGYGSSNKPTTNDLGILLTGPQIMFTGFVESEEMASPPSEVGVVTFPYALEGSADSYVIMLTSLNAGYAYVTSRATDNVVFTGFTVASEAEGTVMYMVVRVGSRPNI